MNGQRLPDGTDWSSTMPNGAYWKDERGVWMCTTPNGKFGSLAKHHVVEHDDQTITVTPSILVDDGRARAWHGFLERGVWREC